MSNSELIQSLRNAIEASPESVPLRKHLGDLLVEAGQFAEAAQVYRQTLDLAPEDDELRLALAQAYFHEAIQRIESGDTTRALLNIRMTLNSLRR